MFFCVILPVLKYGEFCPFPLQVLITVPVKIDLKLVPGQYAHCKKVIMIHKIWL